MKPGRLLIIGGVCLGLTIIGFYLTSHEEIDWDYMGTQATQDLALGHEINGSEIRQVKLAKNAPIELRCDNVKSIMSAVDRRTKRGLCCKNSGGLTYRNPSIILEI